MKRCAVAAFALASTTIAAADWKTLYTERRWFELREAMAAARDPAPSNLDPFFKGALLAHFNRPEEAIPLLSRFLETDPNAFLLEARELLAGSYIKTGQYELAAAHYKLIHDQKLSPSLQDTQDSYDIFRALAAVPPQTTAQSQPATLQWKRDAAGLIQLPVRVNGNPSAFIYDTGANLSVINESLARKFALRPVAGRFYGKGISGQRIPLRLAVAPALRLGNTELRNVVFLVLPASEARIAQLNYTLNGILGFPVIAAAKRIELAASGEAVIGGPPVPGQAVPNLCLDGLTPIIQVRFQDVELPFLLDTGANRSALFPRFHQRFAKEIAPLAKEEPVRAGGVGGGKQTRGLTIASLELQISGRGFPLSGIRLFLEDLDESNTYFYGNIGQDVLRQAKSVLYDFENMQITLR